jgi:hypothetical protein
MQEKSLPPLAVLPVHFNVPEHFIPLSDFLNTAKGIETVAQSLASKLFKESVLISVVVLPPEQGTLKSSLGFMLLGGLMTFTIMNDAFVEGLTGVDPDKVRLEAGKGTRGAIEFVAASTRNFLEKENKNLCSYGIDYEKFSAAYAGKDTFFKTCLNNPKISGVGFNHEHKFSVPRSGFVARIRPEEEDEPKKYLLHDVVIVSPIISKESKAQWLTKDIVTKKTLRFHMEDEDFKEKLFNHQYSFTADDTITALVKYEKQDVNGNMLYKKSAVKIYRLNDEEFAKVPDELEITNIMHNEDDDNSEMDKNQIVMF